MRKLIKNSKGAVTVFITLLLIPAILVSGTAVDTARIYAARSILQDANQMAANSVLTQYNSLLHDLYGLFGVARDDPVLGELLDDYIKVAVFGEEARQPQSGTLRLFYGSDISLNGPLFVNGKTLRNEDVLRRQIEEYMKFRGPVIIVEEFLKKLEGNKIKEDAALLDDKLTIDSDIADLYEKYKELYDAIDEADKCIWAIGGISGGSFGSISRGLEFIRDRFTELKNVYSKWENEEDEIKKNDHEAHYQAILYCIVSLTAGGKTGSTWINGEWVKSGTSQGLNKTIENAKAQADNFKQKFDDVVRIAREIDEKHDEISRKVDELKRKIDENECSDDLKTALTEQTGTPPMSMIERYRDILKWTNIAAMATAYKTAGYNYIDDDVKPLIDGARYRNKYNAGAGSLSREDLASISTNPAFRLSESVSSENSRAAHFAGFIGDSITYNMPPGFLKFAEISDENNEFFMTLSAMVNQPALDPVKLFDGQEDEGGGDAKTKQRNIIDALVNIVETAYTGLTNKPLGAMRINDSETPEPEALGIFDIVKMIPRALKEDVVGVIQDPLGSLAAVGDYVLLLTYCTSMFSNYTTTRPESIGKTLDDLSEIKFPDSITGVPISPEVNYFFQSEWEYLYKGAKDAETNLSAITGLIFTVRLVCNYISVFSVSEITSVVSSIQTAFAWCPPVGLVLGELARAAFVAAESLIDVTLLRTGHKVPLIKKAADNKWVCSPKGIIAAIGNIVQTELGGGDAADNEKGLTYSNYMLFFFITKAFITPGDEAAAELAERTANLIEWNMVNYQNGVFSDEEKMAEALTDAGRFRLEEMHTDFILTASAGMRMLFLSMIFAQNFADEKGISMPLTKLVSASDYRGY